MRARHDRSKRAPDRSFLLGLATLGVIVGGYVLSATGLLRAPFAEHTRTARAVFANTAGLDPGSPVRVRGVDVGKVSSVEPTGDGRTSTISMKLTDEAPRLHRNATADLRWRLLLGGSYQVELDPGYGPTQEGPETIDVNGTTSQVEVDQALDSLGAKQREGIRSTLTELPRAFRDPQAPSRALDALADVAPRLAPVVRSVRGVHPDRDLRRLLSSTAKTVGALDAPAGAIQSIVEGGATTFETITRRGQDLDTTITRADVVLPRTRATLARLDSTLAIADPTIDRLLAPAGAIAPTVRDLRPTVIAADRLLMRARPLLRRLRPAATALRGAARDALPLLNELEPSLRRLDERILPDLALPDPTTKRPTYQMIGPTLASFNAVAGVFDSVSHLAALDAASGEPKVDTSGCSSYLSDLKPGQIATCETLLSSVGQLLGIPPTRRSR